MRTIVFVIVVVLALIFAFLRVIVLGEEKQKLETENVALRAQLAKLTSESQANSMEEVQIGKTNYLILWKPGMGIPENAKVILDLVSEWTPTGGGVTMPPVGEGTNFTVFKLRYPIDFFNVLYRTDGEDWQLLLHKEALPTSNP